ncbi:MAG: universal stress protein [Bryobacteraceae bacterium]|nr:universal stress protein [Bryobacteraceae bacterium]
MNTSPDLRILFPTSFSDACFRATRAVSQLADMSHVSLTIAHVCEPGGATRNTYRELDSFFAEADGYDSCRRILVESSDAVQSISDLCREDSYDLIVAPASERLVLRSLLKPSFRARLLKHCNVPVWTAGSSLHKRNFRASIRTIACLIDFESSTNSHLPLAVAFAARIGARVHILNVIPPVDEGTLLRAMDARIPLMPEVAMDKIRSAFAGRPCPEIDVAVGSMSTELPRLLKRCEADLAFVGPGQALRGTWMTRLASHLDKLPCPVVCMDGASAEFPRWSFQNAPVYSGHRSSAWSRDHALAS